MFEVDSCSQLWWRWTPLFIVFTVKSEQKGALTGYHDSLCLTDTASQCFTATLQLAGAALRGQSWWMGDRGGWQKNEHVWWEMRSVLPLLVFSSLFLLSVERHRKDSHLRVYRVLNEDVLDKYQHDQIHTRSFSSVFKSSRSKLLLLKDWLKNPGEENESATLAAY